MLRPMPLCFFRVTVTTSGSFLIGWKERWTGRTNCKRGCNLSLSERVEKGLRKAQLSFSVFPSSEPCRRIVRECRVKKRRRRKKREGWEKGGKAWRRDKGEKGKTAEEPVVAGTKSRMKTTSWLPTHTHIYTQQGSFEQGWVTGWGKMEKQRKRATEVSHMMKKIFWQRILQKLTSHSLKKNMPASYCLFLFGVLHVADWRFKLQEHPETNKTTTTSQEDNSYTKITAAYRLNQAEFY